MAGPKRARKSRPSSASDTPASSAHSSAQPLERFKEGIPSLLEVARPFKARGYKTAKRWKNLKQVVAIEQGERWPVDFPTYWNIDMAPSLVPQKKYCDVTGLPAKYTDPKTNVRYCSAEVYRIIKTLPPGSEQLYLAARNANVVLK